MSDTPERPDPASSTPADRRAPDPPAAPAAEPAPTAGAPPAEAATAGPSPVPPAEPTTTASAPAAEAAAPGPPTVPPAEPAPTAGAPPAEAATAGPSPVPPAEPTTTASAPAAEAAAPGPPPVPAAPAPAPAASAPPAETAAPGPPPVPAAPAPAAPVPADGAGAQPGAESSFFSRVKRVFNFEIGVYPEVAGNAQATLEAIVVVALATLFFGSFWSLFVFFITVPLALAATALSAGLVTLSARLFNKESPGFAAWFRALAFAQAPLSLGIVPLVGSFIAMVYCIATSVAAIHSVARLPVGVAILTWVIAWLLPLAFLLFLAFVFGGLAFMGSLIGDMA